MDVYVLTEEPYHDNSTVLGVFSTLEKAEAAHPGRWRRDHGDAVFFGIESILGSSSLTYEVRRFAIDEVT